MLDFQAVTWESGDEVIDSDDGSDDFQPRHFVIHAYGRDADARSVHLQIANFRPFLYLKVLSRPQASECTQTVPEYLASKLHMGPVRVTQLRASDVWGFQNGKKHYFLKVSFDRVASMQRMHRSFDTWTDRPTCLDGARLYESNLEPLLRFFHLQKIPSAGWIRINEDAASECSQPGRCEVDLEVDWKDVTSCDERQNARAPLIVAAFDIECHSRSGRFPVAARDHFAAIEQLLVDARERRADVHAFVDSVDPPPDKRGALTSTVFGVIRNKACGQVAAANAIAAEIAAMGPDGDPIVQIGVTGHTYGDTTVHSRTIFTVGRCAKMDEESLPANDPERITVVRLQNEEDLLLRFARHVGAMDPDLITGYNIFGFDWKYIVQRAMKLGIYDRMMSPVSGLSRDGARPCAFVRKVLTSSAMGDNVMFYVDIPGRTTFDLMKIVQRDHKLDSYKLDNVGHVFLDETKHDVSPAEIFAAWNDDTDATARERARVARYCVQDCALCNRLVNRLDIVPNTLAMATVCSVPMRYIFFRGQGVKIFSLVLQRCSANNVLFPTVKVVDNVEEGEGAEDCAGAAGARTYHELATPALRAGELVPRMSTVYDGATVLTPVPGMYVERPVAVLDYASLYPSSMISENISHDTLVMDEAYADVPGVEYTDIAYVEGGRTVTCRYASKPEGVLPQILRYLLGARKATRAKAKWVRATCVRTGEVRTGPRDSVPCDGEWVVEDAFDAFEKKVLDGMQMAYKLTANSLYGQMGAVTSPVYLKPLAACTTATGRKLIHAAKDFMEQCKGATVVYGDTDSVMVSFPACPGDPSKEQMLRHSIDCAVQASEEFRKQLKPPHDLEYEKTYFPFIIFAKKRYVGNKYEFDVNKYSQASMGIALKRRDNAPIVKDIYGGALETILNNVGTKGVDKAIADVKNQVRDLLNGKCETDRLVVSKTLKMNYKAPQTIAHKMLADRVAVREPGNAFQSNDRVPYLHIVPAKKKKPGSAMLQGDRIETPEYVRANGCTIDYQFYVTNQIAKPVSQLFALVADKLQRHPGVPRIDFEAEQESAYRKKLAELGVARAEEAREAAMTHVMNLKEKMAHEVLFGAALRDFGNLRNHQAPVTAYFQSTR